MTDRELFAISIDMIALCSGKKASGAQGTSTIEDVAHPLWYCDIYAPDHKLVEGHSLVLIPMCRWRLIDDVFVACLGTPNF